MVDNSAYSGTYTASIETDLYENTSGATKTIVYSIGVYNADSSTQAIEMWITDGSNIHKQCLLKTSVAAGAHIENDTRYRILPGYKIRFKSAVTTTLFDIQYYDGVV